MVFSITKEEIIHKGYVPFNYNSRKIGSEWLVVADHGQWAILNEAEFETLENGVIQADSPLYNLLEEKGIILTLKNENSIEDFYRSRLYFLFHPVTRHIFVLSSGCTHKCVYCHANAENPGEGQLMDSETAKKIADFVFQSPSKSITIEFQGGEPLLNFETLKFVVGYCKEKNKKLKRNLNFSVVTNLQLMDDEKLGFLVENDVSICTSLDGPAEIHNKNRVPNDKNFNSHENVTRWVRKIKERCRNNNKNWDISALMTTTKKSLGHPKEIIDEYAKNGFDHIFIRYLNGLGFSKENFKEIGYSADEFVEFWKKCVDYIIQINANGVCFKESTVFIILSKILGKYDSNYLDMRSPCGICIGMLAYDSKGDIYSCDTARTLKEGVFCIGNVNEQFKEVMGNEKSSALISSSIIENSFCSECSWKPFCGTCPVMTYSETNSLIPSIPDDFKCKIQDRQFEYIFEKIRDRGFQENIIKKWFSL